MKNKIYLILIFSIALISLTSASSLGVFKQNDCVSLYQLCANCTYVNISSVSYPNSTVLNINTIMTKSNVDYNYTFCETSIIGDYNYKVCGDKDGIFQCESISFIITPTGDNRGFGIFLVLVFASMILFTAAYLLDFEWGIFLSGILFILSGIYSMIYGIADLADLYTRGIAVILIGIGFVFIVASLFNISKGEGVEEDE